MDKVEFLDALSDCIVNNSDIEADADDSVMFTGVEDVMLNVAKDDGDVTVLFTDGKKAVITVDITNA